MSLAAIQLPEHSHFHEGASVQTAGDRQMQQQQSSHIFNECGDVAEVVDPSVCDDLDLYGQFFDKAGQPEGKGVGTMNSTRDEDFWFPADLFTDEHHYNEQQLPHTSTNAAEVVSQSSRADNSTIYSDELELELFEEVPQTIDVPKCKKARVEGEQFSTEFPSNTPLLASWQPAGVGGTEQFFIQAGSPSPFPAPLGPPPSIAASGGYATASPVNTSVKVTKSAQIKDLLAILCENISSDPNQSVQDLMTLRVLLMRPALTPEEEHLLDTVLILFESYLIAGRSRPDIATMVVRDFSFHFKHQAHSFAQQQQVVMSHTPQHQAMYAHTVSPVTRA